jgi:hypothetical protein
MVSRAGLDAVWLREASRRVQVWTLDDLADAGND